MSNAKLIINDTPPIAELRLNRPEIHNAFDAELIASFVEALTTINKNNKLRIVKLTASGHNFSAGADLNWMRSMVDYTIKENVEDAEKLAQLLYTLNHLSKPTVAVVQGAVYGGGVGLVACCDMAIASEDATFCFSEARLGLIPAVISPYVIAAMGQRQARRYFLSGERFTAHQALQFGLVSEVVPLDQLANTTDKLCDKLLSCGPQAQSAAKELINDVSHALIDETLIKSTSEAIAKLRVSEEGQEGLQAFLKKRKPNYSTNILGEKD